VRSRLAQIMALMTGVLVVLLSVVFALLQAR
jgi:hypothetical protein